MNYEKNDVFIGAFVLAALLVFVVTLAAVNSARLTARTYGLHIELANIAGIDKGVEVIYQGYKAGAVDRVSISYAPEFRFIVGLAVKKELRLRAGTTVVVRNKGFGGGKFLELMPPPPERGGPLIEAGATLPTARDMDLMSKANDVMGDVQKLVRSLDKEGTAADLILTVRQAKTTLLRLDRTLADINAILEENRAAFKDTLESARGIAARTHGVLADQDAALRQTLKNINAASVPLPKIAGDMAEFAADLKRHPWRLLRKGKPDPPPAPTSPPPSVP